MSTKTTEWAITTWDQRETATFVPISKSINGVLIDAYGRPIRPGLLESAIPRRPVKMEDGDVAYAMYDDDTEGPVPVIRISEEEA